MRLVNLTITISYTCVHFFTLYSPFKEPFATLTGDDPVVQASGLVITDHTDHGLVIFIHHTVGWFAVVLVEKATDRLRLWRQLTNVAFPQLCHVNMVSLL